MSVSNLTLTKMKSLPISEILAMKRSYGVLSVDKNTSQADAVEVMARHRIQSLPVMDGDKIIGVVSLEDLMLPTIFKFTEDEIKAAIEAETPTQANELVNRILFNEKVGWFLGITKESKTLWSFKRDDKIVDLLHHFSAGVHRVLIVPEEKEQANKMCFLSQTDVIRYLYTNRAKLGGELAARNNAEIQTLVDFAIQKTKLVKVKASWSAMHSFRTLGLNDVSAAPVVDEDGKVVASISYSDLKGLNRLNLFGLLLPTSEFLAKREGIYGKPHALVECLPTDTLASIIAKVAESGVHRVYVINKAKELVGVVSLSDIMMIIFRYDED